MIKLKPFMVAAALVALALAPVTAESKEKISKPRSNEVILVARFVVSPSIDRDFYSHYVAFKAPGVEAKADKSLKGKTPDDSVYVQYGEVGKNLFYAKTSYAGSLGEIAYFKVPIPKDRQIRLDAARVYVVDNGFLFFDLPIFRKIAVPEGSNYVYLGTFTYSLKDEYFSIGSISLGDEFDAATVAVAKAYGPAAQLVRANLLSLEDQAPKK